MRKREELLRKMGSNIDELAEILSKPLCAAMFCLVLVGCVSSAPERTGSVKTQPQLCAAVTPTFDNARLETAYNTLRQGQRVDRVLALLGQPSGRYNWKPPFNRLREMRRLTLSEREMIKHGDDMIFPPRRLDPGDHRAHELWKYVGSGKQRMKLTVEDRRYALKATKVLLIYLEDERIVETRFTLLTQ